MDDKERLNDVAKWLRYYASVVTRDLPRAPSFILSECGCGARTIGISCPVCLAFAADALEQFAKQPSNEARR